VNHLHLRWATPTENQNERVDHGTSNRGARQGQSKLTDSDILRIRTLASVHSQVELATMFDVGRDHISRILSGERWGWL
jgi:hypothetical protein